ncbi:MAG: Mrp/NBP35 family ATP-binding protein [Fibrobacteres bacterium]|nr:Mrp/NBP35 family ATP-binding protein [Fibrobacterota bacterium]
MSHAGADVKRLEETLSHIGKKYIVLSGKGGVGKSTVAVNLAYALTALGKRVGLLDCDLHGPSIPTMTGTVNYISDGNETSFVPAETQNGLLKILSSQFFLHNLDDSVIWRGPLKHSVIAQFIGHTTWGELDYLIIDCPPGTGDEPLSVAQTAKPDAAIIVTTPQAVATADVRKSIDFCKKLSLPIFGIIENMSGFVCPHCKTQTDIFGIHGGKEMADETGESFLGRIPIEPSIVPFADNGRPIVEAAPDSVASGVFRAMATML